MTKADRIRKLYASGLAVKEIAEMVKCRPEYVRVAARQRADGKRSAADLRFVTTRSANADINEARRKGRAAYQAARAAGADRQAASCAYRSAWSAGMGLYRG